MFLLFFLIFGFSWGIIRGGNLRSLAKRRLRWAGLVLLALLLQIVAFSSLDIHWISLGSAKLHITSYLLLVVFMVANFRSPGFCLMGMGLLSNLAVIWANGGYMPTYAKHLAWLGIAEDGVLNNSALIQSGTPLWWLGDVFLLPLPIIGNVFSIGDLLIGAGASYFAYHAVKPTPAAKYRS